MLASALSAEAAKSWFTGPISSALTGQQQVANDRGVSRVWQESEPAR
jgi:hypothetical protein